MKLSTNTFCVIIRFNDSREMKCYSTEYYERFRYFTVLNLFISIGSVDLVKNLPSLCLFLDVVIRFYSQVLGVIYE